MTFIEQVQGLVSRGEIQDETVNFLEDSIDAALGNPISAGKILIFLARSPFLIREQLFWTKLEAFLNGVYLSEDDSANLRARLTENGEKPENAVRLVESIDGAETQQIVHYLINATRCLLTDFIDRPRYFRICHVVTHTLEEDLKYLAEHVDEEELSYCISIQGLLTSGLMYQSVFDGNREQKYSFTDIARLVDRYAVSYDNDGRYPNPCGVGVQMSSPQISIPSLEWNELTDGKISTNEEASEMLNSVMG